MMRKQASTMSTLILAMALSVPASATPPLTIGAEGFFTNFYFPHSQTSVSPETRFPWDNWGIGGQGYVAGSFSDEFSFKISLISDPIMRNYISTMIMYQTGFASIGIGPIIGVLNSVETPVKSGLSTNVRLEWPGLLFVSVKADSSIGAALTAKGDYLQETGEIAFGFYVPNAICSLSMGTRKFYIQTSESDITIDSLARYVFSVDIFKKHAPYNVLALLGYQSLSKTFADGSSEELGSVLLGVNLKAAISRSVKLVASLESGVYTFGLKDLAGKGPDPRSFIFSSSVGVVISLDGSGTQSAMEASSYVEETPTSSADTEAENPITTEETTVTP